MINRMSIAIALVVLALPVDSWIHACSCVPPPPPLKAAQQADAVFVGQVTKIDGARGASRVTLRVEMAWKGIGRDFVTIGDGGYCAYLFRVGDVYIVYAYGAGQLETSMCTRTRTIAEADKDIQALGAPTFTPEPKAPPEPPGTASMVFIALGAAVSIGLIALIAGWIAARWRAD